MRIREFHDCVIDKRKRWFKIQLGSDIDESARKRIDAAKAVGCIAAVRTLIGPYKLICTFAIIGDGLIEGSDGRLELLSLDTDHHRYLISRDSDLPSEEDFDAEFDEIAAHLNAGGITPIRIA